MSNNNKNEQKTTHNEFNTIKETTNKPNTKEKAKYKSRSTTIESNTNLDQKPTNTPKIVANNKSATHKNSINSSQQDNPQKANTHTTPSSQKHTKIQEEQPTKTRKKKGCLFAWLKSQPKAFKVRYIPIFSSLALLFITSLVLIFTLPTKASREGTSNQGYPLKMVAPFVDMSSWVDQSNQYSLNGVPNLNKVEEQTGITYYNLGFIQPDTTTPLDSDGNIRWGWGGYFKLSPKGNDGYQYPKIDQVIKTLKEQGAKYIVSVGGQLGKAPWAVTQNVDKLEKFYLDIIDTYDITRLDLDIEESNQDASQNQANAKAIKRVQNATGIEIVLTIPIMPSGWTDKQINIIKAYLDQGVHLSLINSMTMCYGAGVWANEDYGDASVRAIENSVRQMQEIWANYGNPLSESQAYAKTGATVDIGYESDLYPIFTTSMTKKVVDHAKQKGYGMVSYWSLNRDAKMESNKGVNNQYEFLKELNNFLA